MALASEIESPVISKNQIHGITGQIAKKVTLDRFTFLSNMCIYQCNKKHWMNKNGNSKLKETTKPGQCVSVDTFESSTTGFVAQIKGTLTDKKYSFLSAKWDKIMPRS